MSQVASEKNLGAIVNLESPEEGGTTWKAVQVDVARSLPPGSGRGRQEIRWGFGPVSIVGYVDTDSWEIGVSVTVVGINVGNIYGNLKDGVGLDIDLFVASGSIKFYLKNGNEVWVSLALKVTFDGSFDGDYKIISV